MQLEELLQHLGIFFVESGHRHVRAGWLGLDCPFCGAGEGKYHLGINTSSFAVSCWRCGSHSLYSVLKELTGRSGEEIYKLLHSGVYKRKQAREEKRVGKLKLPKYLKPFEKQHLNYLRGRGFDPEELQRTWGLLGIGAFGRLKWRIFIPIGLRGEIVSWTTRSIGDVPSKYITARPEEESIHHKDLLYGSEHAHNSIVVLEGPADVWRLGAGGVAVFGLKCSKAQLEKIASYPFRAVCFDSEPAAQKAADRLVDKLRLFPGVTQKIVLDSEDMGAASNKEVRLIRRTVFGE